VNDRLHHEFVGALLVGKGRPQKQCSCSQAAGQSAAPAELRSRLGLAVRRAGALWRCAAVLAPLLALPAAAPLGVEPSNGAGAAAPDCSGAHHV
jgi:hypothetical protein